MGPDGNAAFVALEPAVHGERTTAWSCRSGESRGRDGRETVRGLRAAAARSAPRSRRTTSGSAYWARREPVLRRLRARGFLRPGVGRVPGHLARGRPGRPARRQRVRDLRAAAERDGCGGGTDARISDMGPDGNTAFGAFRPAVAYNPATTSTSSSGTARQHGAARDGEHEIFGQRLNAATGADVGTNDFRICDIGPDGDANFGAAAGGRLQLAGQRVPRRLVRRPTTRPLVDNERDLGAAAQRGPPAAESGRTTSGSAAWARTVLFDPRPSPTTRRRTNTSSSGRRRRRPRHARRQRVRDLRPAAERRHRRRGRPERLPDLRHGTRRQHELRRLRPRSRLQPAPATSTCSPGRATTTGARRPEFEIYGQRYSVGAPTAVGVIGFAGSSHLTGIELRWRAGGGARAVAFRVWRNGRRLRGGLIPAEGGSRVVRYRFVDRSPSPGHVYLYRLEVIGIDGGRAWLGPLRIRFTIALQGSIAATR